MSQPEMNKFCISQFSLENDTHQQQQLINLRSNCIAYKISSSIQDLGLGIIILRKNIHLDDTVVYY